jgi:hypothetical protein
MLPFPLLLTSRRPAAEQIIFAAKFAMLDGLRSGTPFPAGSDLSQLLKIDRTVAEAAIKTLVAEGVLVRAKLGGYQFARGLSRPQVLQSMVVKAVQLSACKRGAFVYVAGAVLEQKRAADPTAPILLTLKDETGKFVAAVSPALFQTVDEKLNPKWPPGYHRICAIMSGHVSRERGTTQLLVESIAEIQHGCLPGSVGLIPDAEQIRPPRRQPPLMDEVEWLRQNPPHLP